MDLKKIKSDALEEIRQEDYRKAVDEYKIKLRNKKSIWNKIFPYKIIFIKKEP